jgi:hypothetical protein
MMAFRALAASEIRDWIGVPATVLTDAQLQGVIDAEEAAQAEACDVPPGGSPDLDQALLRRVGRAVAARSLPTGLVGVAEWGMARLPGTDAEINRYEAPYLKVVAS